MERQNDADRRNLEDRKVKFAVIYYSKTGHTREMGEEIAEGIRKQGGEVKLFSIEEPLDNEYISECGGVIFGTPVYLANTCWQMKKWFDTESASVKLAGKLGGVYSTAHFAQGGGDVALMTLIGHMLVKGMMIYSGGASLPPFGRPGPPPCGPPPPGLHRWRASGRCREASAPGPPP